MAMRAISGLELVQEEQKRAVLDDVEKWRDRLGFILDYSFWFAVAGGHAGLCEKSSYREVRELRLIMVLEDGVHEPWRWRHAGKG